jgi:hypothetical protein
MITPILATLFILGLLFTAPNYSSLKNSQNDFKDTCNFTFTQENPPKDKQSLLKLENDEKLVWPLTLACKPESFGYSSFEASSLFKDVTFGTCNKSALAPSLSFRGQEFEMSCKGRFLIGPKRERFGRFEFGNSLEEYQGKVRLTTEEFVIGTCREQSEGFFEDIIYRNVINKTSLNRALKTLKSSESKPINIAMIVLDSVSRRSFFRKLPKTLNFLNNQSRPVHDFYIHNVHGEYSADSFMPTFMGDTSYSRLKSPEIEGNPYDDSLIFKYLHEKVKKT